MVKAAAAARTDGRSMLIFGLNMSENLRTPVLLPKLLALARVLAESVGSGDDEIIALPEVGAEMLSPWVGSEELSEKAFLLLIEEGVLRSNPKKLFLRSTLRRLLFPGLGSCRFVVALI